MSKRYLKKLMIFILIIIVGSVAKMFPQFNDNITTNQQTIKLIKCIDGDTAKFSEIGKTRFLFIDTPESNEKVEKYGLEAAEYTCTTLKNAQKITYEYDGDKTDQYGRSLAWIFVDGQLLQEKIAKRGYVKKFYDYGNYRYEDRIRASINDKYSIFEGVK